MRVVALVMVVACAGDSRAPDVGRDAERDAEEDAHDVGVDTQAWCMEDEDGDGIADRFEGSDTYDVDGDGVPNRLDTDSDGDGIPDEVERGDVEPCFPPLSTDMDFLPDFLDPDSDGDGLSDADEEAAGLDRLQQDSDGDGCQDFAEVELGGCSDPRDAFIPVTCGTTPAGRASFVVPEGSVRARIELLVPDGSQVTVEASSVVPAGAARIESGAFSDVAPGATLSFDLRTPDFFSEGPVHMVLESRLVDQDGTVLERGHAVLFGEGGCPLLI